jgi:hypothetical protein
MVGLPCNLTRYLALSATPCYLVTLYTTVQTHMPPCTLHATLQSCALPCTLPCNRVRYLAGDGVVAITVEPAVLTAEQREMNADMDAEMDDLMGALPCYLATLALPCNFATLYTTWQPLRYRATLQHCTLPSNLALPCYLATLCATL